MALAEFYHRGAVAASQVLQGFDETAFRARLEGVSVAIDLAPDAAASGAGRALADLAVRLVARLYPAIRITAQEALREQLVGLALSINPAIDVAGASEAALGIGIGRGARPAARSIHFAGCTGWSAQVSRNAALPVARTEVPFGAGAAACLAATNLFNEVFTDGVPSPELSLPVIPAGRPARVGPSEIVLVGAGAIGHGVAWALANWSGAPKVRIVDGEEIDLGNLQRYVLATRADEGREKVAVLAAALPGAEGFRTDWAGYAQDHGQDLDVALACLDTAEARRQVQAALPRWVVNAWTQPGDLGVSAHEFKGAGACLCCLYLPTGSVPSQDVIYAEALHIEDQLLAVRSLLYTGQPVPEDLLQLIAQRLGTERDVVLRFSGRPLRELYSEGLCGGAVLPLGSTGLPRQEAHVPLAHQSALAGVLAAARLCSLRTGDVTMVTRLNVLGPIHPEFMTQPAAKDPRGICICQDPDFLTAYCNKYKQQDGERA